MQRRARDRGRQPPALLGIVGDPCGLHLGDAERQAVRHHLANGVLGRLSGPLVHRVTRVGGKVRTFRPQSADHPAGVVDARREQRGVFAAAQRVDVDVRRRYRAVGSCGGPRGCSPPTDPVRRTGVRRRSCTRWRDPSSWGLASRRAESSVANPNSGEVISVHSSGSGNCSLGVGNFGAERANQCTLLSISLLVMRIPPSKPISTRILAARKDNDPVTIEPTPGTAIPGFIVVAGHSLDCVATANTPALPLPDGADRWVAGRFFALGAATESGCSPAHPAVGTALGRLPPSNTRVRRLGRPTGNAARQRPPVRGKTGLLVPWVGVHTSAACGPRSVTVRRSVGKMRLPKMCVRVNYRPGSAVGTPFRRRSSANSRGCIAYTSSSTIRRPAQCDAANSRHSCRSRNNAEFGTMCHATASRGTGLAGGGGRCDTLGTTSSPDVSIGRGRPAWR